MITYNTVSLLADAILFVKLNGFISKTKAQSRGIVPTCELFKQWIVKNHTVTTDGSPWLTTITDVEVAQMLLYFISFNAPFKSTYIEKLNVLAETLMATDTLSQSSLNSGMMVAMVNSWISRAKKEEKKKEFQERYAKSEFIGSLKIRGEFFVKVIEIINKDWGSIWKLVDVDDKLGFFFTNASKALNAEVNDCILIKATPIAHEISEYHGLPETKFNRIKILDNVGSVEKPRG